MNLIRVANWSQLQTQQKRTERVVPIIEGQMTDEKLLAVGSRLELTVFRKIK